MTRIPEFRAWYNGKMHDEIVIISPRHNITEGGFGCPLNAGIKDFISHDGPDTPMILMEYIDLKATGDVKIFEDDVVKFTDDDGSVIIGRVTIFRLQWGLMNDEGFYPFTHQIQTSRNDYHEVLGNIHKNPDWQETLCNSDGSERGSNGQ